MAFIKNIKRSQLLSWCSWFLLGNLIAHSVIGLRFLNMLHTLDVPQLSFLDKITFITFIGLSYISQFSINLLLPYLFLVMMILLLPFKRIVYFLGIIGVSILTLWLVIDTFVYKLYRFHLIGFILKMAVAGIADNVFALSNSEIFAIIVTFLIVILLEWLYARWVWNQLHATLKNKKWVFNWVIIFLCISVYVPLLAYRQSDDFVKPFLVNNSRIIPLYLEGLGSLLPRHLVALNSSIIYDYTLQPTKDRRKIYYPLAEMSLSPLNPKMNLVIIAIDAWRFDALNESVTPHLTQFAKDAWQFTNHYSGGNATGPGIFSLFYSIPATYWTSMELQKRSPILLDLLIKENYNMGVFASATLKVPAFDQTVFSSIKNLDINDQPGKNPFARDQVATTKFINFINNIQANEPFFGFIFYDSAHGYCLGAPP